jgi:hypothetical protein
VGVFDYLFQQQQQQQQHGSIVAAVVEVVSSGEVAAQVEACDLTLSSASNSADNLVKFLISRQFFWKFKFKFCAFFFLSFFKGVQHGNSDADAAAVAALEAEEAAEAKDASEEDNNTDHSSPITVTVTSGSTQYIAMAGKQPNI